MNFALKFVAAAVMATTLSGCALKSGPLEQKESPASLTQQQEAQAAAQQAALTAPTLKRKIALGRITNETTYGKSLLRDQNGDPLGKQVSDMLAKTLIESNQFTVLERSDIASLTKEAALSGNAFQAIGADVLLIGSVTEFGRKTTGKTGFVSSTKKQTAYAKMDVRVVDTATGLVVASASGAGEATNEAGNVLGWGGRATYDGTLNDKAISQAVSDVVSKLITGLADRPWRTYFLSLDKGALAISGGQSQGLKKGMVLSVKTQGKKVKSGQTGFMVTLPGEEIAKIEVLQTFGDSPETEGSMVKVISGSLGKRTVNQLVVEEAK